MDLKVFRKMPYTQRTSCVLCDRRLSSALLEMRDFPITEIFTTQASNRKWGLLDQEFFVCGHCGHGQLGRVIDVGLQYGNYHFRSSQSVAGKQAIAFFINYLNNFIRRLELDLVVEIGCNDLYLLKSIRKQAQRLVGIDPILKGHEKDLSESNVTAIGGYFEDVKWQGSPDLVICKDTLEHISDPKKFLQKIIAQGHSRTLYAFQFPLLDTLVSAGRIDQIFHQHLNYFSMRSIKYLLEELGLEVVDFTLNYNLWGSILLVFRQSAKAKRIKDFPLIKRKEITDSIKMFQASMAITKQRLRSLKEENVYGYGASPMLPVLDYYLEGQVGRLKCIMDDDSSKKGLRYLNLEVEIKTMDEVPDLKNSVVLMTAIACLYNVRVMLAKLSQQNPRQIIVPLNTL